MDEESWNRTFDLNVKGCFLTCKHVLPHMLSRRAGAIVNLSSIAAVRFMGYPYPAYHAAKAAVNSFTMGLALQYAKEGIRVNAIMPGADEHPPDPPADLRAVCRRRRHGPGARRGLPHGQDGHRLGHREGGLFLVSDEAAYITGVSLPVDGGLSCRAA